MIKRLASIFKLDRCIDYCMGEMVGRFVGFIIGFWVSKQFTRYVYEKKSLTNLWGLAGRKKIVIKTIPDWVEMLIALGVGFIVLELVTLFFKEKIYLIIWARMKIYYSQYFDKEN